jgi:hypothetical protein
MASDSIQVQREASALPWVHDVCFLELPESFYTVADDVVALLDVINRWLESLGDGRRGIPKELLFWLRHAEGGMTTQRIQDLFLLIRSYCHLLESRAISKVVIIRRFDSAWEDAVLTATARSRGIDVETLGPRLSTILQGTRGRLRPFVTEPYYLASALWTKLSQGMRGPAGGERSPVAVVLQLCSSAPKHVVQLVPLMKALAGKGCEVVALCWGAHRGATELRKHGLDADELERWVPVTAMAGSLMRAWRTRRVAAARWKEIAVDPRMQYRAVPTADLLWPSVSHFFMAEAPRRYRLMVASRRYFERRSPVAMKFWTLVFPEATVPFRSLERKRPLVFHWAGPLNSADNPYQHHAIEPDLVMADSPKQAAVLAEMGFRRDRITVVGQAFEGTVKDFGARYSQAESRSHLKIPPTYSVCLFYDPGYLLRGYLAASEQAPLTECLLKVAREHPSVALMIKPHPGHHPGMLESQLRVWSLPNVFMFDRLMLPYHCLNASDLVITKLSAIGVEAMYLERPVVSPILDGERRFRFYEDAAEYVSSTQELESLTGRLLGSDSERAAWTAVRRSAAARYAAERRGRSDESAFELGAEAVANLIARGKRMND